MGPCYRHYSMISIFTCKLCDFRNDTQDFPASELAKQRVQVQPHTPKLRVCMPQLKISRAATEKRIRIPQ